MNEQMQDNIDPFARYARQVRFAPFGLGGQDRLRSARVLIVGMGALGSSIAEALSRSGVGFLRLVDRDFVELTNLQRQTLYTERDVEEELPKAIAAERHLGIINSTVDYEAIVADIGPANIEALTGDVDLILDGTDNFETRFLINDVSIKNSVPWIYGGCVGCEGQTMNVFPGESACLRCLMPDGPPSADQVQTCDTTGVLAPIVYVIASIQALEAIKYLSGNVSACNRRLQTFSLWDNRNQQLDLSPLRQANRCPTCDHRQFEWLNAKRGTQSVVLCGRNAVQICPAEAMPIELKEMETKLSRASKVRRNDYLLKFEVEGFPITLFPDGRAIIGSTDDLVTAKRLYAQYIGN